MIKTEKLTFTYPAEEGGRQESSALREVELEIEKGSFVAILGHNGSGKSTLAKHMNAVLLPTGGTVWVEGLDTADPALLLEVRRRVGMVFQNPDNQIVANVVEEDVAFAPENLGVPSEEIRKRVDDALEAVGMEEYARHAPHLLSGGQKQRVAIARALTLNPKVLLCDEATSALDPNITRSVLDLLRKINRELGITIVVVTHQMEVVKRICDQVAILEHGVVTYTGSVEDLFLHHPEAIETVIGGVGARSALPSEATYKIVQHENDESLLSRIAIGTGIDFNVVWGGLDTYRSAVSGSFILRIPTAQPERFERFLEDEKGIDWEAVEAEEKVA